MIVLIFGTFLLLLIGWIAADVWRGEIAFDDALIGAIAGGFLAGMFGILAAAFSISSNQTEVRRRENSFDETMLHGIVAKLLDLNDVMQKNLRHFRILDQRTKVFFQTSEGQRTFSKPLESMQKHIAFSVEERTFLLRKFGADCFNKMGDIQGISESFNFLHDRHVQVYYELMDEVFSEVTEREGYHRSGGIDPNSIRLMAMMDIDGGLFSLLDNSCLKVEEFLETIIELSNANTSVSLQYLLTDTPPSADNHKRVDY
ncbi:MAG: hypothetical protein WA782_20465 [Sulfitobacter sp.]